MRRGGEGVRRLPKFRKVCKWTALGAAITLMAAIALNGFYGIVFNLKDWQAIRIYWGMVEITNVYSQEPSGVHVWARKPQDRGDKYFWAYVPSRSGTHWIPLWWGVPPLATIWLVAWKLDRAAKFRDRNGCCKKCSYDIRGLEVCPECGMKRL